jgi:ATP-dependent RNA helicase RhlE
MPKVRQNLFFSATMPTEIGKLAGELQKDPAKVSETPQATTVEKIDQKVFFIEGARKRALLAELFEDETMKRVLIFTRTKRGADRVAKQLAVVGVEAAAIHGDKTQGQRERSLAAFKAGQVQALVATDIAARGIDVDNISHVIQYELPNVPEAYVHRIGRTARAGAAGIAIAFCGEEERGLLRDIQRVTKQTIPSWDRRNDRTLGASEAALRAAEPAQKPEKPRQQQQHHRGRKPNGGHGQPQHRPVHRPDAYNPLTDAGAEPKRKPRRRNRSRNRAAAKANGGASVSA